jgi:hypothetical protein
VQRLLSILLKIEGLAQVESRVDPLLTCSGVPYQRAREFGYQTATKYKNCYKEQVQMVG